MKTSSEDIKHRTYTDMTGIPTDRDLHTIVPRRAYRIDEPQLKNEKNNSTVTTCQREGAERNYQRPRPFSS